MQALQAQLAALLLCVLLQHLHYLTADLLTCRQRTQRIAAARAAALYSCLQQLRNDATAELFCCGKLQSILVHVSTSPFPGVCSIATASSYARVSLLTRLAPGRVQRVHVNTHAWLLLFAAASSSCSTASLSSCLAIGSPATPL
jgi:hypothetical protein